MQECSEIRLTVDFLNTSLKNKTIINWLFTGGKYTDNYPEGYEDFYEDLPLTVDEVNCNGKFIYFKLSSVINGKKYYILHSLNLSGGWQKTYDLNSKWFIETDDGQTLWFRDIKSSSMLKFTRDEDVLQTHLSTLGPDIMSSDFKLPDFKILIKKHAKLNITSFLMDQSIISGCGNYIKSEILYDAKVSPLRQVKSLNSTDIDLIYQALCVIPRVSYNKGVSFDNYKGQSNSFLKIYGKNFATRTKTPDGHTTYWDPAVQR